MEVDRPTATDITGSELRAIEIALDELVSYIDTVGMEGGLDDEEMPTRKLEWARDKLRGLLDRHGVQSHV